MTLKYIYVNPFRTLHYYILYGLSTKEISIIKPCIKKFFMSNSEKYLSYVVVFHDVIIV